MQDGRNCGSGCGSVNHPCPCEEFDAEAVSWSCREAEQHHCPASVSKIVHFVQLDDLDAAGLGRVGEAAFLTLGTSPGNHQAWVAVSGFTTPEEAKDFSRRLRKGAWADHSASGATRVAGTVNYKRKYEPDFPTVRIGTTALAAS